MKETKNEEFNKDKSKLIHLNDFKRIKYGQVRTFESLEPDLAR